MLSGRIEVLTNLKKKHAVITTLMKYDIFGESGLINKVVSSPQICIVSVCTINELPYCIVYENIASESCRGYEHYRLYSCRSIGDPRTQLPLFRHGKLGADQAGLPRQAGVAEGESAPIQG